MSLKILSISSDRKIFDKGSPVRRLMIEYGQLADELHIIIFAEKALKLGPEKISSNTFIYPTDSINRWFYVVDAIRIGKKMKSFDLVTTQDPFESALAGLSLSKYFKAKFHIQIHTDFLSPYFKRGGFLNIIRLKIADKTILKADGIRVVSQRIKRSLKKYNLKIEPAVLPVYVDPGKFEREKVKFNLKKKFPQFEFLVLVISRLEREGNIKLTIQAMEKIFKKYSKVGLIIVGDGRERKDLEKESKSLGLEKNIIFEGWQNDPNSYYRGADLYLSTSNYEGYGRSLVEALLSSLPVVTTDVGVAGDLIINKVNALVCPVEDKSCISENVNKLIEDQTLLQKLKENIKNIRDNFLRDTKFDYLEKYKKTWTETINS